MALCAGQQHTTTGRNLQHHIHKFAAKPKTIYNKPITTPTHMNHKCVEWFFEGPLSAQRRT